MGERGMVLTAIQARRGAKTERTAAGIRCPKLSRTPVYILLTGLFILLLAAPALAAGNSPQTDIPYDMSALLKSQPAPKQIKPGTGAAVMATSDASGAPDRPADIVLTLYDWDPAHAGPHDVAFWKMASGSHSDVYVAWNDLTPPPTSSQQDHTITPEQVQAMADEFDARIWESDVFHFGMYEPRGAKTTIGGSDGLRAAIFVYNIRDEAYWSDYRFYIAGYFWGGLNDELGVNAIFIDSYDWANRTGADSARPHLYEGTIAHEFEHLIHNDVDHNEDSFVDEGLADLAEQFIYGPGSASGHIGNYLVYHRDSLTDWKGELFDYGNAVLWQDYLWEQAGGGDMDAPLAGRVEKKFASPSKMFGDKPGKFTDPGDLFVWNLVHDQANGLAGLANQVGGAARLEQLHRDFTLANLLDGKVTEPEYNYRNLALGGADSMGYTIDDGIDFYDAKVGGNLPPTRKNVWRRTATEAWGAYYRTYQGTEPGFNMRFQGDATAGVAPYTGTYEWFSGGGNGLVRSLSRTISGVGAKSTLQFWTWFDIEQDWDYGYVEASGDNGTTWTVLPQLSTLPMSAGNIYGSSAFDGDGGLTGNSGGWQLAQFDLDGFSGDVQIRFRYNTDEAVNGAGWYIDDIAVNGGGTPFADPVDSAAGWTNPDGWLFTTGLQNNDWTADVYLTWGKGNKTGQSLTSLVGLDAPVFDVTKWFATQNFSNGRVYGIIGNRPDGGFISSGRLTLTK